MDFEIFTGDGFQNFLTELSNFSPGSNIKTIMADVKKRPGMDKVAGDFPAGIFSHRGFPRWVLFLPGWEPAGHLAGTLLCYVNTDDVPFISHHAVKAYTSYMG